MLLAAESKLAKMAHPPKSAGHFVKHVKHVKNDLTAEACGALRMRIPSPRLVFSYFAQGETAAPTLCQSVSSGAGGENCGAAAVSAGRQCCHGAVPDRRGEACLQFPGSWGLLPASQLAPCRPWVQCRQCEQRYNGHSQ